MADAPLIDIRSDHWAIVSGILRRHVPHYEVWAFGSRAGWTAKQYSDLDLAIITDKPLPLAVSAALSDDFSESDLPWKVDVVDWATTGESFRRIIERDKVVVLKPIPPSDTKNKWPITRIEDIAEKIAMGPFGSNIKVETFVEAGIPIISGAHLRGVRVEDGEFNFVTEEHAERMKNANVFRGDVIFTHAGNIGQVAYIPPNSRYERYVISQRQFYLRCDLNKTDPVFVSYFFHSYEGQHKLLANASQTGVPSIARPSSYLKTIELSLPPLKEQRAIAHILGALDDKIELNRRTSETLEAMARALFKSWFMDFDGVPAQDRQESELGLIPKGWRVSTIGEEVAVFGGSTPSTKDTGFWEGGTHHWATPKDLSMLSFPVLLNTERRITDAGLAKIKSGLLPAGTVLLSSRAPIGYLSITEVPTAINQGFIAMKCNGALSNVFVLQWCRANMDAIISNANGSTFLEISKSNFRPLSVVVPPAKVLTDFDEQVGALHQRIVNNEYESRTLATLRDTLLPMLISGKLRITDAERLVENVEPQMRTDAYTKCRGVGHIGSDRKTDALSWSSTAPSIPNSNDMEQH